MFAVAGRWLLDPGQQDRQREVLQDIVASVQQLPGFVRGFWSRDVEQPVINLTYIVFEQRDQAEAFMNVVRQNAPAQSAAGVTSDELRLVEVEAHA